MKTWNAVVAGFALILALLVATQPLYVLGLTLFGYGQAPGGQYYTEQTKDTTRVPESDPAALSRLTAHAAYPPGANQSPSTVVRVPADNWQTTLAAS